MNRDEGKTEIEAEWSGTEGAPYAVIRLRQGTVDRHGNITLASLDILADPEGLARLGGAIDALLAVHAATGGDAGGE